MKTQADFKRAMVVGSKWTSVHCRSGQKVTGRECLEVAGKGFALTRMAQGATADQGKSWCDWGKAANMEFSEDGNTVTIFFDSTNDKTCSESLRRREAVLQYTREDV